MIPLIPYKTINTCRTNVDQVKELGKKQTMHRTSQNFTKVECVHCIKAQMVYSFQNIAKKPSDFTLFILKNDGNSMGHELAIIYTSNDFSNA